jgi:hypothetical protein
VAHGHEQRAVRAGHGDARVDPERCQDVAALVDEIAEVGEVARVGDADVVAAAREQGDQVLGCFRPALRRRRAVARARLARGGVRRQPVQDGRQAFAVRVEARERGIHAIAGLQAEADLPHPDSGRRPRAVGRDAEGLLDIAHGRGGGLGRRRLVRSRGRVLCRRSLRVLFRGPGREPHGPAHSFDRHGGKAIERLELLPEHQLAKFLDVLRAEDAAGRRIAPEPLEQRLDELGLLRELGHHLGEADPLRLGLRAGSARAERRGRDGDRSASPHHSTPACRSRMRRTSSIASGCPWTE